MKREFLQNIKVGDQPLPKEIIDAILDEHSRSIGAIKAEKESLATQLQTAKDGLKAFEGVDVKDLQGQITKLQQDLADKDTAHKTELANMAFDRALEGSITNSVRFSTANRSGINKNKSFFLKIPLDIFAYRAIIQKLSDSATEFGGIAQLGARLKRLRTPH